MAYWHAFDDQDLLGVNAVHFLIGWNSFPKIYKFKENLIVGKKKNTLSFFHT